MKLFLSSLAISSSQGALFMKLVGRSSAKDVKIALIENAADPYPENKWVAVNRENIRAHGFKVDIIDLKEYWQSNKGLYQRFNKADAIWLGGGNTYWLRKILCDTKADEMIRKLIKSGKVYGGGSAGAIIAGPTINYFQPIDSPINSDNSNLDGLGLTDTVVLPHWDNEKYISEYKIVEKNLIDNNFKIVRITDKQALIIDGNKQTIF